MNSILDIEGLNQSYHGSQTLWDIDLSIEEGKCTVVMGRNGVGKTTLLASIMGLLALDGGKMELESASGPTRIDKLSAEKRADLGIGYVPQGRQIFPLLTVEENLKTGLAPSKGRKMIPEYIFELFPVLKEMLHRRGGDLSGGQQQQLAIGRALVLQPKFLILDEPTEGIQPNVISHIGSILLKLNREMGLTLLLVEQKLPFARRIADNFIILDRGRVVSQGTMEALTQEVIDAHLVV